MQYTCSHVDSQQQAGGLLRWSCLIFDEVGTKQLAITGYYLSVRVHYELPRELTRLSTDLQIQITNNAQR